MRATLLSFVDSGEFAKAGVMARWGDGDHADSAMAMVNMFPDGTVALLTRPRGSDRRSRRKLPRAYSCRSNFGCKFQADERRACIAITAATGRRLDRRPCRTIRIFAPGWRFVRMARRFLRPSKLILVPRRTIFFPRRVTREVT